MKGYQTEREDFIIDMMKEGVPPEISRLILRHTQTLTAYAFVKCNEDMSDEKAEWMQQRIIQLQQRIEHLLRPYKTQPIFQNDPRGAVVKLRVPSGRWDDWGQTGMCVPTR